MYNARAKPFFGHKASVLICDVLVAVPVTVMIACSMRSDSGTQTKNSEGP